MSASSKGSNLHTIIETEAKVFPKPPLIKRILLVDDDPDVTLTFKAGLEGHYYGHLILQMIGKRKEDLEE